MSTPTKYKAWGSSCTPQPWPKECHSCSYHHVYRAHMDPVFRVKFDIACVVLVIWLFLTCVGLIVAANLESGLLALGVSMTGVLLPASIAVAALTRQYRTALSAARAERIKEIEKEMGFR